jgi:hypothetical protein
MIAPFVKRLFSGKISLPWTIVQGFPDSEVFVHPVNEYPHQKDQSEQIGCQDKKELALRADKKGPCRYPAVIVTFRVSHRP